MSNSLKLFHPLLKEWFESRFPCPTEIQEKAWPVISQGQNVLITAPTGMGKTLTAFFWAINSLMQKGAEDSKGVQILYISPLKALNNDIRRNLTGPLEEIQTLFTRKNIPVPEIRIGVRSGDTTGTERSRMDRKPPQILITTPESLNILLTGKKKEHYFPSLKCLILDEVHNILDNKRGTHLITAVERLTLICGEFQRIALSATVNPLQLAADFVGGFRPSGSGFRPRQMRILRSSVKKQFNIQVDFLPSETSPDPGSPTVWEHTAQRIFKESKEHRSTLVFVNSRRLAEKLTLLINNLANGLIAYSHHGSLSREVREEVESRMKKGELKAIIATSSLELGIDIGALDLVILIETPFNLSSAIQRIGRAGHQVGETSKALMLPSFGQDLLNTAVTTSMVYEETVEPVHPPSGPLDVLAQIILSMIQYEEWRPEDLLNLLRCSWPYRELSNDDFYDVIAMLEGKYADRRIRELEPRLFWNRKTDRLMARESNRFLLYAGGGTIPDRGYYRLEHAETGVQLGELDEEFVWERFKGDVFTLGTQNWKISDMDEQRVKVIPWEGPANTLVFWRAENMGRPWFIQSRCGDLLKEISSQSDTVMAETFKDKYKLGSESAESLADYLCHVRNTLNGQLPHSGQILIENCPHPMGGGLLKICGIHTGWGKGMNFPLALMLQRLLGRTSGFYWDDISIMVLLEEHNSIENELSRILPDTLEEILLPAIENTGFFGGRFRENAGRALLLPPPGFNKRVPLWMNRIRAKKLMEKLRGSDFPVFKETWREILEDILDTANLKTLISQIQTGHIAVTKIENSTPSALIPGIMYEQMNDLIYVDDKPVGGRYFKDELLKEMVLSSGFAPKLDLSASRAIEAKLQRTAEGWKAETWQEIVEHSEERLLCTPEDWRIITEGLPEEVVCEAESWLGVIVIDQKTQFLVPLSRISLFKHANWYEDSTWTVSPLIQNGKNGPNTCEAEFQPWQLELVESATPRAEGLSETISSIEAAGMLLSQLLETRGVVTVDELLYLTGYPQEKLAAILDPFIQSGEIAAGDFTRRGLQEFCTTENLNRILRQMRQNRDYGSFPLSDLSLLTAACQGIGTTENLEDALYPLLGWCGHASIWEEDIFPARLQNYSKESADRLLAEEEIAWTGAGKELIRFIIPYEAGVFIAKKPMQSTLLPADQGRFTFWELSKSKGQNSADITKALWKEIWQNRLFSTHLDSLRRGILSGFRIQSKQNSQKGVNYHQWKNQRPLKGTWFAPGQQDFAKADPLDNLEKQKERIRLLFLRYPVLNRQILEKEISPFRWKDLLKTLRLMELAGEAAGGVFIHGLEGRQFIDPRRFTTLKNQNLPQWWWINSCDPASLCGLGITELNLPPKRASTYLLYRREQLILIFYQTGKRIEFRCSAEEARSIDPSCLLDHLRHRSINPHVKIQIQEINGESWEDSPYREIVTGWNFRSSRKGLTL